MHPMDFGPPHMNVPIFARYVLSPLPGWHAWQARGESSHLRDLGCEFGKNETKGAIGYLQWEPTLPSFLGVMTHIFRA